MPEFIIVLAIAIGLFFLFRAVILWYWKVNEVVRLLTDIRDRLPVIEKPVESTISVEKEHSSRDVLS
jgi:hypothetical protein